MIQAAREERAQIEADPERVDIALKSKQNEIDALLQEKKQQKDLLDKYGPTIWHIQSISRIDLHKTLAALKMTIGSRKAMEEITTTNVALLNKRQYEICKLGLKNWENLRDPDNHFEIVPFSKEAIEYLEESIAFELSNEIAGVVTEEEAKNSVTPPSSPSGTED